MKGGDFIAHVAYRAFAEDRVPTEVMLKMARRVTNAAEEYGRPMAPQFTDPIKALRDAQEEAMDMVFYLEAAIQRLEEAAGG